MQKKLLALLLVLCTLLLVSCNGGKSGKTTAVTFSENGILSAEFSTDKDGTAILPQPAGTHSASCIGWTTTVANERIFLPVGASFSYKRGDVIDFSPVYLHMTTLHTAELDLSVSGGGIRFTTTVGAGDLEHLARIGADPQLGTLIISEAVREQLTAFTHAALADQAVQTYPTTCTADKTSFYTLLNDVPANKTLTPYTALGYAKLTYSNGESAYIYAGYEASGAPLTSVFGLAKAAADDLSNEQTDRYLTPVDGKFSPYTAEQYTLLKSYSKIPITLIINYSMRGNRGLSDDLLEFFDQRTIARTDKSCAEEWAAVQNYIGASVNDGALVLTAKDGTHLDIQNISSVTFQNKVTTVTLTNAICHNGSIYVPYTTHSGNY